MFRTIVSCLYLIVLLHGLAQSQARARPEFPQSGALEAISFHEKDAVAGVDASPAIKLPFQCTGDGTVFITMVPLGGHVEPPLYNPPPLLLTSVSLSGRVNTFPLDQVTEQLYNVREIDHYASDSVVVFLVQASSENKPTSQTYKKPDGTEAEFSKNTAERHFYIITFDRDGRYKRTAEIEDIAFQIQRIGIFPSGSFLAFGYDNQDHSPKLSMLKDDGGLMRTLHLRKGVVPGSVLGTKENSGKGAAVYIAPSQFVPHDHSIVIVQNKTDFPILEVSEGGAIRVMRPKLPPGTQIEGLIESDQNLYARVNPTKDGSIFELNPRNGAVLRRFELNDDRSPAAVSCVHEGKFLAFEHGEGRLVPLVGEAEGPVPGTLSPRN